VKAYLEASVDERVRRRHAELQAAGRDESDEDVRKELALRDEIDIARDHSPLRPADDALVVHTDDLTIEQVVDKIVEAMPCS